jgi:ureidoglycolate lyase
VTTLSVEQLTAEGFDPFGDIVVAPARDADAAGPGWRWWGEMVSIRGDGRPWGVGYLDLAPTALQFDWAERHMRSAEGVFATDGDIFLYVGPANDLDEPSRIAPFEDFRVFRIPAGSGVVMSPGVWHGAPFAADNRTTAIVLLLEGTGRDDTTVVRFPDAAVEVTKE